MSGWVGGTYLWAIIRVVLLSPICLTWVIISASVAASWERWVGGWVGKLRRGEVGGLNELLCVRGGWVGGWEAYQAAGGFVAEEDGSVL